MSHESGTVAQSQSHSRTESVAQSRTVAQSHSRTAQPHSTRFQQRLHEGKEDKLQPVMEFLLISPAIPSCFHVDLTACVLQIVRVHSLSWEQEEAWDILTGSVATPEYRDSLSVLWGAPSHLPTKSTWCISPLTCRGRHRNKKKQTQKPWMDQAGRRRAAATPLCMS